MDKIEDFFLDVLRNQPKDGLQKYLSSLDKSDWQALYELSVKSGLFPAFYKRLTELNLEGLPEEFISSLKTLYLFNFKRNHDLEEKMFEIAVFFYKNNIAAIPLKGPSMARHIYGDLDLRRTSSDLDFLIDKAQFKEAISRLKEAGYYLPDEKAADDRHYRFRREVPFLKKEGKDILRLELHWDLRDIFTPTHIDEFWAGAKNVDYNGARIITPSNEDLLLYLILKSVFVFDTNFIDIRYLFDIHNLISKFRDRMDWEALAGKIRRSGSGVHAAYALRYSADFFRTPTPQGFLSQFRVGRLKNFLLRQKTDRRNVLWSNNNVRSSYIWYFLASSYLFSDNIFGAIKNIFQKIIIAAKLHLPCEI